MKKYKMKKLKLKYINNKYRIKKIKWNKIWKYIYEIKESSGIHIYEIKEGRISKINKK